MRQYKQTIGAYVAAVVVEKWVRIIVILPQDCKFYGNWDVSSNFDN
jgi:hypothetical protein